MTPFENSGLPCLRWRVGASSFEACPTRGARLMRWWLDLPSGRREVLYWPETFEAKNLAAVRGGNPILFPFMGRTYADGEKFAWKGPDGVRRPMPHHGFARDGTFELIDSGPSHFTVEHRPTAADREAYPWPHAFSVRYEFHELRLRVVMSLENRSSERLPWCPGHHFYFQLPWHAGLNRGDYRLKVPARKTWRHGADGKLVPYAEMKGVTEVKFDDARLVDCLFTGLKSAEVHLGPRSGEEDIVLRIGDEPIPDEWAMVVTWTEAPESPFYCVEPWMGAPNSPTHGKGLRWVEPGALEQWTCEVALA